MGTTGSKRERSDSGGGTSMRDSLDADRLDLSRPGSKIMVGSPLEDAFEFSPSPSVKSASMRIPDQQQAVKGTSAKNTVPTMFRWRANAKTVAMAGSFNEWSSKIPLNKSHNDFVTFIDLPQGRHEYKFYVDGQWVHNPDLPSVDNQLGTLNNVVEVKKSDFEVFDALASDLDSLSSSTKEVSGSPQDCTVSLCQSGARMTGYRIPPSCPLNCCRLSSTRTCLYSVSRHPCLSLIMSCSTISMPCLLRMG
ncbi:PRKAB2 [Branchiostoma lanceolatum]|uniref:5'-AMP-activated protein kinase subunit beta-1 n=1 Tax=Branchiostoma lanceolatum TaxID=7740 RepID=A0A8K0ETN7_BRALA|nr:PRKAB2 [Branchiostoma lanceolatum]